MKHRVFGKKLGRNTKGRKALIRSLVAALVERERIVTTVAKAKVLKPVIDKLITKAKKQTLAARRQVLAFVGRKEIADKIFNDLALRFSDRQSGYTTLVKLPARATDKAPVSVVEFVKGSAPKARSQKPKRKDIKNKAPKKAKVKTTRSKKIVKGKSENQSQKVEQKRQ